LNTGFTDFEAVDETARVQVERDEGERGVQAEHEG
jgi:hypothetical protein